MRRKVFRFCRGLCDRLSLSLSPCPPPPPDGAGPGPRAADGAAQHVKKIQHVRKAHSSYAIFAVLDEIDVLSSRNVTGDRNLPGKPGGGRPTARHAESRARATRPLSPTAGRSPPPQKRRQSRETTWMTRRSAAGLGARESSITPGAVSPRGTKCKDH